MERCPECGKPLSKEMIDVNMCWNCGKILDETLLENPIEEVELEDSFEGEWEKEYADIILSTAPLVEGYRIVKQYGIVYGETVFRHGFLTSLSENIMNTIDSFKFSPGEMSGSMRLIERARDHAYEKMIKEAKGRGANAIIAVQTNNTFGADFMYLQLCGTAVYIMPEAEFEKVQF